MHSQLLTQSLEEQGWRLNEQPATYEQLHRALLAGLLGNIGFKRDDERGRLTSARAASSSGSAPGSSLDQEAGQLDRRRPSWSRPRACTRAASRSIEPRWLEEVGGHLLKRNRAASRTGRRAAAQVVALERAHAVRPAGLQPAAASTSAPLDPDAGARDLHPRGAGRGRFRHARAVLRAQPASWSREIEHLEHKSRRQDVLVDDELIHAFYDEHMPQDVTTAPPSRAGASDAERDEPEAAVPRRARS